MSFIYANYNDSLFDVKKDNFVQLQMRIIDETGDLLSV